MRDTIGPSAAQIEAFWAADSRWHGIQRTYGGADVVRLRGSVHVEHTLARRGAERLWHQLGREHFVSALGSMTGNQAVQAVKAGLSAIYLRGWQVAADANLSGQTYPDQSLYPANSAPALVKRINNAFARADQIPNYFGPLSPAETTFVTAIQADLMKHFHTVKDAGKARFVRDTNAARTGASSYATFQWTWADGMHPSQLWYDKDGNLIGADFPVLQPGSVQRRIVGVSAIPMQFTPLSEQPIHIVEEVRPLRMPR